jgi:pyrroloquinoline quinone (PQQ) biosynthesis protein C
MLPICVSFLSFEQNQLGILVNVMLIHTLKRERSYRLLSILYFSQPYIWLFLSAVYWKAIVFMNF